MIIVGGENLIDLVQGEPAPNGLPQFTAAPGGSQYNVAMALGRQKAAVSYLTPISTDKLGDLLAETLEASGAQIASARVDAPSSLAVVTLENGQPSYQFYRENTAERLVTAQSLAASMPTDTRLFQLGGLSITDGDDAGIWTQLFRDKSDAGLFCALDPNVRWSFVRDPDAYRARMEQLFAASSLIKLSDEDCELLFPGQDMHAVCQRLFADAERCQLLVLTQGGKGATAFHASGEQFVPAVKVEQVADTVGAGDTFMATLLRQCDEVLAAGGSVSGLDASQVERMLAQAAKAAAINCTRTGCNPPTLDELGA